ncbi:DMT family transporter [Isoalcanivorax beigongshangi]|uniref:DMT family transporter n=1 Tax=Isoalcanivorax beigongshangi TaxID=3238810 RepID=A0ABV4AG46_9GAMM
MPLSRSAQADLIMVLVTLCAALGWIFSREAVTDMPALMFMSIRFFTASLLLALVGWRQLRRMSAGQFSRSLGVGAVFGIGMTLWVLGLRSGTPLAEGAFIASLSVVMVPVIARTVFRETVPTSTWVAIPVAITGLAFLAFANGVRLSGGQLYYLASAACFAVFFNLNTRAASQDSRPRRDGRAGAARVPVIGLTAIALAMVGVCTTLLSVLYGERWQPTLDTMSLALFGWIVASVVIATAARFLLQTVSQSMAAQSNGAVILILEPLWVTLFAAYWFSEYLNGAQILGCSLIFASLLINRWQLIRRVLKQHLG